MDRGIYVAGVGMTQFGRHPSKAVWQLAAEAVNLALEDADADPSQIEQVLYSGATQGALQGQTAAVHRRIEKSSGHRLICLPCLARIAK